MDIFFKKALFTIYENRKESTKEICQNVRHAGMCGDVDACREEISSPKSIAIQ